MAPVKETTDEGTAPMNIRQKLAIGAAGVLSVVGIGSGVAFAQASSSTTPPAASSTAAPDTGPEAPEAVETPGVEEPGEANLPGGGHADPAGENVDHQCEGVE
jgi:hypothetical protein